MKLSDIIEQAEESLGNILDDENTSVEISIYLLNEIIEELCRLRDLED